MLVTLAVLVAIAAALRGMWSPCGLSMLSSLNPVSERERGHRFAGTAAWYVAGAGAGGALLGGACALGAAAVALLPTGETWRWLFALAGALVATASDSSALRFALPMHPRQVDERWLRRYRRWIYAGGFGVQIGTGFATYIMTAAVYLTALLAVLTGRPWAAFAVGLTFGVVRGLGILVTVRVREPAGLRRLLARVDALDSTSLRIACVVDAAAAIAAGVALSRELSGPVPLIVGALVATTAVAYAWRRHPRTAPGWTHASAPVA